MIATLVMVSAIMPLLRAWWSIRRTTLAHVFVWVSLAWLAWLAASQSTSWQTRYLALVLTSCAGVAVMGARRPGVVAWHAVVAGLAAVLLLPLAEGFFSRGEQATADTLRWVFLCGAATIGIINYLPTRLAVASLLLLGATGAELYLLRWGGPDDLHHMAVMVAGLAPWMAWAALIRPRQNILESTRLWLEFRDRFGVVWALRLREQFHSSSHHRNSGLELTWSLVRRTDGQALTPQDEETAITLLRALMGRFGMAGKTD
jgi:hypothetical protein